MSQAEQPAGACWGQNPNTPSSPKPARRRLRKRRYHVPPEALGLDFYRVPTTTVSLENSSWSEPPKSPSTESPVDPAAPATASAAEIAEAEFRSEAERKLGLSRRTLWTCIVILLLILFQKPIGWLLGQAVSAWPSINGF